MASDKTSIILGALMKLLSLCLGFFLCTSAVAEQFVIIHRPGKNWEKADEFKAEDSIPGHIRHYSRLRAEGRIFAKADPAVKSQILEAEVHPWRPAMRPAQVKYYFGQTIVYETDGKTVWRVSSSLIKRVTSPIDESIFEYQATPDKDVTKAGQQFLIRLNRIAGTNRFELQETTAAFEGELTLQGPEWDWTGWTYDVKISGGLKLEGSAKISEQGIFTSKILRKQDGNVFAYVKEELLPISEKEYLQHRLEILKY